MMIPYTYSIHIPYSIHLPINIPAKLFHLDFIWDHRSSMPKETPAVLRSGSRHFKRFFRVSGLALGRQCFAFVFLGYVWIIYGIIYGIIYAGWWYTWVTYPPEKYESQIGSSSQLLGKIKNVPNHQSVVG